MAYPSRAVANESLQRFRVVMTVMAVMLSWAFAAMLWTARPVAAGTGSFLDGFGPYAVVMLVVAVLLSLYLFLTWRKLGKKHKSGRIVAVLFVGFLFIASLANLMGTAVVPQPPTPPGTTFHADFFTTVPSTVQGGSADAASEIFDTQGGTGGGGETPTATLCGSTQYAIDRVNKIITVTVTITTTVATSGATFSAPDICATDIAIQLRNAPDVDGVSGTDTIPIFAKWIQIPGPQMTEDGNGSASRRNILMRDNTFGWYIGFGSSVTAQATDSIWYSSCPANGPATAYPESGNSVCNTWIRIGEMDGTVEEYFRWAFISRNYGHYGYTQPTTGFSYVYKFAIAGPDLVYDNSNVWTVLVRRA